MIAVLIDSKGFSKSIEIATKPREIILNWFNSPIFYPEPIDKNIFDRQQPKRQTVVFLYKKELYEQVYLYEEQV
jgi:hypothetical protein